jgi:hypothetical protein
MQVIKIIESFLANSSETNLHSKLFISESLGVDDQTISNTPIRFGRGHTKRNHTTNGMNKIVKKSGNMSQISVK